MKKFILLFIIVCVWASCEKMPINGKLDGMWQLVRIDTLHSRDHSLTTDNEVKNKRIYYSVQLRLITLRGLSGSPYIQGRFTHEKDSLFLYDLRAWSEERPCSLQEVAYYGLDTLEPRFGIEELSKSKMILRSDSLTLYFRKF